MNGNPSPLYCDKAHANLLTALLVAHGVRDVVVCPGSRNGALVHNFHACPDLRCHPVTDERSAAFVGLGLIEATRRTVAVCVTSGSALLATLPATAEAFYRHLPLLVVSADRPPEWIDQLDGQTIRQEGALRPYAATFTLPEIHDEATRRQVERTANEALLTARRGHPAHINVPLSEPLFSFTTGKPPTAHVISEIRSTNTSPLPEEWMNRIREARLPVLVIGQYEGDPLEALATIEATDSLLVLPELLANVPNAWRTALLEHAPELATLHPDLVLHAGGNFVHKQLKLHLRGLSGCPVVRIGEDDGLPDTFCHLCAVLRSPLPPVVRQLAALTEAKPAVQQWKALLEEMRKRTAVPAAPASPSPLPEGHSPLSSLHSPLKESPLSSPGRSLSSLLSPLSSKKISPLSSLHSPLIKSFCALLPAVPGVSLHLGNSMAVRLAARYLAGGEFPVHCNRGVNGIEGSLSAAVGHSLAWPGLTVAILGDLSFFYDQNALWNERLNGRLRILVLNNGGGGIFHSLPGLSASAALPGLIDGAHSRHTAGVAETFGLRRMEIRRAADIAPALSLLLAPTSDRPVLIEAFTY